jgi:phosphatidylserine synthase
MFDISLRNWKDLIFEKIFNRLFMILDKKKISPNAITIYGFFLGLIACYTCYLKLLNLALFFWLLNRFIDGLDGIIV